MASEAVNKLNKLITTCHDGKSGYEYAADKADDATLKSTLSQYATERAGFAQELSAEVSRLGGEATTSGSAAGSLHQSWLGLKDLATGAGDKALLGECVRGDEHAVKQYGEVAEDTDDVPAESLSLVTRQQSAISQAVSKLKQLHATAK